jgi:hypothetical protein
MSIRRHQAAHPPGNGSVGVAGSDTGLAPNVLPAYGVSKIVIVMLPSIHSPGDRIAMP